MSQGVVQIKAFSGDKGIFISFWKLKETDIPCNIW